MPLDTFVALAAGLLCVGAGLLVVAVSAWIVLSRRVREGPRPVPPWWWERREWED